MRYFLLYTIVYWCAFSSCKSRSGLIESAKKFNTETDLLLTHYDCKTDVDDLHAIAAFKTFVSHPDNDNLSYHVVAGTYGHQDGLYVPPNELLDLCFGIDWTDAHVDNKAAIVEVHKKVIEVLSSQGHIWIAEAGQSDFSADLIANIMLTHPEIQLKKRIHIVQHSDWNELNTTPAKLEFVKTNTDYHKIPDGNVVGNGSPGLKDPNFTNVESHVTDQEILKVWQLAIRLASYYNGREGRYLNDAVDAGGLDFSDSSEYLYILDCDQVRDVRTYFDIYSK